MNGTKTEVAPGVWRLRVYVGRNAKGYPVQRSKTIHVGGDNPKPGAGTRLADRELANMIAEANKGNTARGTETVGDLLDYLTHFFARDADWEGADQAILTHREGLTQKTLAASKDLADAVAAELSYY